MIARREKFQRVYDLRERVFPAWGDDALPSLDETMKYFIKETVRALGIARAEWLADYFRLSKRAAEKARKELLGDGVLSEAAVEGWAEPGLMLTETHEALKRSRKPPVPTLTTLLSPFDSLVWDRKRARQLFDFDFSIECYLPPAKRKYGYYLLPILSCGRLVGRIDAKAHRKEGIFEVKGLFWEPGYPTNEQMIREVNDAVHKCADWHQTPRVVLQKSVTVSE